MSSENDRESVAPPKGTRERPIKSCIPCRSRKRKCDRVYPVCGPCHEKGRVDSCTWDARLFRSEDEQAKRRSEMRRMRRKQNKAARLEKTRQFDHADGGNSTSDSGSLTGEGVIQSAQVALPEHGTQWAAASLSRVFTMFTGINRTWFEMVLRRFGEIERLYGTPAITQAEMHGLYDMWRHFLATDSSALQVRRETPMERRSLCNTFCALAAFVHASSNSSLQMASHTDHMARMAIMIMDGLHEAMDDEDLMVRIMRASNMVNRAINPFLKSPGDHAIVARFARKMEEVLDGVPLTTVFPEVLSSRMMALLHQGRVVEGVREAEGWRDLAMSDPELPYSNIKFRGLIMFILLHNGLFLALEKAYDPVHQVSHFNRVRFDGLSEEAQRAYITNMNGMKELFCMMPCIPDFTEPVEQSAFERLGAFFMMWVAFSMYWTGDYSLPGDWDDSFDRAQRIALVRDIVEQAMRRILLDPEDCDPLNTPCWVTLMAGMHTLSALAPMAYCTLLEESGCLDSKEERLSSRGRLVQNTLVEALERMKVS